MTSLKMHGALPEFEAFSFLDGVNQDKGRHSFIFIVHDENLVDLYASQLKTILDASYHILTLPAFDCIPYDRASPSQNVMQKRIQTLMTLHKTTQLGSNNNPVCLILSIESFLQRVPPAHHFDHLSITLELGDHIQRETLLHHFEQMGFRRSETVFEIGDYAIRGSIIDCFSPSMQKPIRLDFFGDELESLREFDVLTQKSTEELLSVTLTPVSELLLNDETITHFRKAFRASFPMDAAIYQAISNGRHYSGMEHFLPLFYPSMHTLLDYMPHATCVWGIHCEQKIQEAFDRIALYYDERQRPSVGERPYYPLAPEMFYLKHDEFKTVFNQGLHLDVYDTAQTADTLTLKPLLGFNNAKQMGVNPLMEKIKQTAENKAVIIACKSKGTLERIKHFFQENTLQIDAVSHFSHIKNAGLFTLLFPAQRGCEHSDFVMIPDHFFLGEGKNKKASTSTDRFFKELNTYAPGDFLVHRNHGVGKYVGLETIAIDRIQHDCVMLEYADADKLFLPVENMDVLTHFAKEGALVDVDRLGTAAWQHKKAKAKKKLLEVAQYLLDVAAQRQLKEGDILQPKALDYEAFCKGFPYVETEDQASAIADMENDLISGKPMDRLVCGDVGFGKTEVALRAAFIAASTGHQVVIVVPTTLLARQHFANFQQRFKDFPYHVEMLCRLVKPKKTQEIRDSVKEGKVHIVIATHAAFSDKLQFANLGLLIIDEEHHFGVKQKEKIKNMRTDIHVLTLTATPIPRTLQMSFTGIREMSLMTTPPVDRLPVRTFLLEQDFTILRDVMMREYNRGGQIFFVSPRLEDLPKLQQKIKDIAPELRIAIAHGQMPASDLEDMIQDFYDHKFDVLLSTNIIESGIDIPNANTLIVHKAHLFGLAQLYQIRGRIGRGKKQGYAYLTVPPDMILSDGATKRLKVLQSLDHLGAGFNLASHDLDIRGAGNLVGEEQSGHVKEVGIELYQQMLQEAILSLRLKEGVKTKEKVIGDYTPTLNLGLPVLIPETYVADLSLRLGLYKRVSDLKNHSDMEAFAAELIDRFGPMPEEVSNLMRVIELKYLCYKAGIEKIDAGGKGAVIQFHQNVFTQPDKLMTYIQQNPKLLKIRPDQKLALITDLEGHSKRLNVINKLCQSLVKLAM